MNAQTNPHLQVAAQGARPPRMSWLVILTGAVLMLSGVPTAALARSADTAGTNLTIVLVHGGFAGPEGWDEVRADLVKDGYSVVAPRLRTMDAAEDVATVRSALDAIPGKKILVGHSYGGFVTTQAAAGRSDVVGLVYTAAFLPRPGESLISLGTGYAPPAAIPHLIFEGEAYNSTAEEQVRKARVEIAFFGARAFSPEHGLMDFDPEEARVKRAIASIADKVVGLVDHSKWARIALLPPVVATSDLDAIVCDRPPPDSVIADLTRRGVQVLIGEGNADGGEGR